MSRHQRLSQRQRDKQLEERHQAHFRESYLDHMVETAHIGVRHFANPIVLHRKRRKPKHANLDAVITYLHNKIGFNATDNNTNKKRPRENDSVSSFERRRKRRKIRHQIHEIRKDDDAQKAFYKTSNYSNINEDGDDMNSNSYCVWRFYHQRKEAQEIMYQSGHRCVLCLKYEDDIYSLQKHVICWHSKLTFDVRKMNPHLSVINVECKASNQSYLWGNNRDLNEYYYGWINIWNNYYLKCDTKMRSELHDKFIVGNNDEMDINIDIAKIYASKWDFHSKLSLFIGSRRRMGNLFGGKKSKLDILSTFSLSCNQFKNRSLSSLTNGEKLLMVNEVLQYPLMNGRMSKLCKFIGLKNVKYLKKLMAIYPMLLLLNKKEISLHLISKWTDWKCNIKRAMPCENITNNDLKQISLKEILSLIRQNDKGITGILPKYKLWICSYLLNKGGKSFISHFCDHLQSLESLDETDANTYIANSSLYNVYYNFCGYMMLCGQFPLSKQGINALHKWWNEVQTVFGFGFNIYQNYHRSSNIKIASNHSMHKKKKTKSKSKKRNIRLNEKVIAIRDIVYNKKEIEEYMTMFDVKEKTIIRWISNSKNILQRCEAEGALDGIDGIYHDEEDKKEAQQQQQTVSIVVDAQHQQNQQQMMDLDQNKEETIDEVQFKAFLIKAREYLSIRRPKRKPQQMKGKEEMDYSMDEMGNNGGDDTEDSEYDPMNESATNRRIASCLNPKTFEREYKTRNVNLRRGRIESHGLKYNKGYYHGTTYGRVNDNDLNEYKNGSDTEVECDDDWLLQWESNLLFDFEDISFGEKLMMKHWNEFIRKQNKNKIYASFMVPVKLIEFAICHKEIIARNNLRLPFLFHCITLWEFGFIEAKCIQEAMHIITQKIQSLYEVD